MSGAGANARSQSFEALADRNDKGAGEGRTVDPGAGKVLSLEASVGGYLQEVGSEHGVLVGTYTLGLLSREGSGVWVFHDFELVLLVFVEEAVKGRGGEVESLGDQGGEGAGEDGHLGDV